MTKQNASKSFPKTIDHEIASNQRTNTISGEFFINKHKGHNFCNELCHLNKINTICDFDYSIRYFFDLNTDNTIAISKFRNDKKISNVSLQHLYYFKTFVFCLIKASFDNVHRITIFDFNLND